MAKNVKDSSSKQAKDAKPKSLKDQKKELEARLFGEKNSSKKKEIQGLIKKIEIAMKLELDARKKQEEMKRSAVIRQVIPVGVDPKTILCLNFANGNCDKGENCQFSHEAKKSEQKKEPVAAPVQKGPKMVCRFLVDALNSSEYNKNWTCPLPNCNDIHKLLDLGADSKVEVSLEEYIELQRQTLNETGLTPVTEETFKAWKEKKEREEALHAKRVAALTGDTKGVDLFKLRPEIFEDDVEADGDMDYAARDYDALLSDDEDEAVKAEE